MAADRQTHLGLIHDLVADPEDGVARSIYADWLEERGDPLAELVRIQAVIRRAESSAEPTEELIARERDLLDGLGFDRPGRSGREPSSNDELGKDWNHGVFDGIATLILHQSPPASPPGWPDRFGWYVIRYKCPGEFVYQFSLDQTELRALLASPVMAGCVGLELMSLQLTTESVRLLAKSPAVANLLRLDLSSNKLDAAAVAALVESPHLQGLLALELNGNELGDEGLHILASSGAFPRLRQLRLIGVNGTPKGLTELARSSGFSQLRYLSLSHNRVGLRATRALAASEGFPELTCLELHATNLDDRCAVALAESSGLAKLSRLYLAQNEKLTDDGAVAVIRSPNRSGLRELGLMFCRVGTPAVEATCATGHLFRNGWLRPWQCALTDESLRVLAAAPAASALHLLELGDNAITDAGARALAASPHLKGLRMLRLDKCRIGFEGVWALTAAEAFPRLWSLSMDGNPVGDEGLLALAGWWLAHGVRDLKLTYAGITAAGVLAVVERGYLRGLSQLNLGGNDLIGDEGIAALANCPDVAELRSLKLNNVGLTDEGANALIESPYLSAGLEVDLFDHRFASQTIWRLHARFAKVRL